MTREVEVTRIVKETITEQVDLTPAFDAEAEKEAVDTLISALLDAAAKGDREARLALSSEDWMSYECLPDWYHVWTPEDEEPNWFTDPAYHRLDD